MNELVPFKFQDVSLKESCWLDKKLYFTRRAIGEWLGYVKPRPDVAITKIVAKNPHIRQFAVDTRLVSTDGKEYEMEVYDPIGLQLIVMESRQPKAIQYKIAVAHLVAAYMRGEVVIQRVRQIPEPPTLEGLAMAAPFTRGMGKAVEQLCIEMQRCPNTIRKYIKKTKAGEPIKRVKEPGKLLYIHKKHRDKYETVLELYAQGVKVKDIIAKTQMPRATVYRWISEKNTI